MDFEQQKPITDEFRNGWERIYAQQEARKTECVKEEFMRDQMSKAVMALDEIIAQDMSAATGGKFHPDYFRTYPNGCPILSEGPMRDDL
jgi:hypothetical protein